MAKESATPPPAGALPDDDPSRQATIVTPDQPGLPHIGLAGGTYTVLISGDDTAGAYTLIDMLVPPGGGPVPHRHDFEEMFTIAEGEAEFTFRGTAFTAVAGETVNIPANAPHFFRNRSSGILRMLCLCVPAGQDELFARVGDPVATRTTPAPVLDEETLGRRRELIKELAPQYRTEMLAP
jgi:quercetin dioxygenase-like cupin family protein